MSLLVVKLIGLILVFIGAIIKELHLPEQYKGSIKVTKVILLIVGLGMAFLGEFLQYEQEKGDSLNREIEYQSIINRADTTLNRVDSNLNISNSVLRNTDTSVNKLALLQGAAKQLVDSLGKQISAQQELFNQVTGGKSIPKLDVVLYGKDENGLSQLGFNVSNHGKYNIPDVAVSFVDNCEVFDYIESNGASNLDITQFYRHYNLGLLNVGHMNLFYKHSVPEFIDTVRYAVNVMWRNGSYIAQILFTRNQNGRLEVASKKYLDSKNNRELKL